MKGFGVRMFRAIEMSITSLIWFNFVKTNINELCIQASRYPVRPTILGKFKKGMPSRLVLNLYSSANIM